MLEAPTLLIHPWQRDTAAPRGWNRPIADGTTSSRIGRVNWLGPAPKSWFNWFRGERLEVLETDDAALLMTLVRSWRMSRLWDVYDAEDQRVGSIAGPVLLDSEGGRRGYFERHARDHGRVVDPAAQVLAEYTRDPEHGVQIRFADREMNPFLRMLLLACALAQDASPSPVG
jgi:hypothetical protein